MKTVPIWPCRGRATVIEDKPEPVYLPQEVHEMHVLPDRTVQQAGAVELALGGNQPLVEAVMLTMPGVSRLTGSTLSCRRICLRAWTYLPWTSSVR